MKMNPIFNLLRRTMFAALAATTIACGGDDPVVASTGYLLVSWLFLYFLYKKRIFLKV